MFRTATTAALATAALLAASAGTAQADNIATPPQANVTEMAASIKSQMGNRAFGYQFAIAKGGNFATSDKYGTAVSAADNGGASVPMQPTMKMDLMSATKTVTAIATMKLLRANYRTVESSIDPYLPSDWQRGAGFNTKSVTFRHLLTHTSGIGQAIAAMNPQPTSNSWDVTKAVVAGGTVVNSQRQYKNMNYVLLQVLNAELYKRSGGGITQTGSYNHNASSDTGSLSTSGETYTYTLPVTEDSHPMYAQKYLRKLILEPAGLTGISCKAGDPATEAWSYPLSATQNTNGGLITASVCGGHMSLRLSSMQHVQLLAHLRHGTIIDPADRATMDQLRAGWEEDSNGGDGGQFGTQDAIADTAGSAGAFWHGGDALGTNQIHTCGATFSDGIEVSLIVNSTIVGNLRPCTVIRNAWNTSK